MEYGKKGVDIPIGVLYYIADPRFINQVNVVIEHKNEIEDIIYSKIIEECPEAMAMGGVNIVIDDRLCRIPNILSNQGYSFLSDFNGIFPTVVYRCPHFHNAFISHPELLSIVSTTNEDTLPMPGQTIQITGEAERNLTIPQQSIINLEYESFAEQIGKLVAKTYIENINIQESDIIKVARAYKVSVVQAEAMLRKSTWEGETDLLSINKLSPDNIIFLKRITKYLGGSQCEDYVKLWYDRFAKYMQKHMNTTYTFNGGFDKVAKVYFNEMGRYFELLKDYRHGFEYIEKRNNKGCPSMYRVDFNDIKSTEKSINETLAKKVLYKVTALDLIKIEHLDYNDFYWLMSKENSNDLLFWFRDNGKQIEKNLEKMGFTWCYSFEYQENLHPCIYMYFGKDISRITVEEFCKEMMATAPEDRKFDFFDSSIGEIDLKKYMTVFEKVWTENGLLIYDENMFSSNNINDYKIVRRHIRHLEDEKNEKVNMRKAEKRGRKKTTVRDCIVADDVDSVLERMAKEMKKLPDGPSQAKYINNMLEKGELSTIPPFNALQEEGLISVKSTAWSKAISIYR